MIIIIIIIAIILLMKPNIILFANTIWFLEKFKYSLIYSLTDSFNIKCLYLRNGPPMKLIE